MSKGHKNHKKHNKTLFEWVAPEYKTHDKGPIWTTMAGSLTAALVAYAILSGSWTMALAFMMLALVYYLQHRQTPSDITLKITELGIQVADILYPWNHMRAFWIIYEPPFVQTLHIKFAKRHQPELVIQLADENPVMIRKLLLSQLPEWEGKEEAPLDILVRVLKL